jgi:hypothetical protein
MLYLAPPFDIINGVTVLKDHKSDLDYYFMPGMPALSSEFDPVTGQNIPQISLIKYRGEEGTGGLLNFEVNLGVDEATLDDVCAQLQQLHHLREKPRLAPVVLEDGRVRLMILGKQTPEPPSGPAGSQPPAGAGTAPVSGQPQFVLKIDHYAKSALYGRNQAIFSVQLDAAGVAVVEDSLRGELMPVGVVYSLDFLALRPAYSVSVVADWDRVQKHFEESFNASLFFSSVEIDKVIDELIENQIIQINADTFVPEGEDSAGVIGRRDQAINEVKEMVLETFFEPSLDPIQEEEDGWDKVVHTAERLSLLGATRGRAGVASFGYKKIDMTRLDKKKLNVTMNERTTVRRSIYPQAHLKGLFRVLRDSQGTIDLSRFVREVNLDDEWFKRRTVTARSLVNTANDAVDSVNVTLRYGNEPKTILLDAATTSGTAQWNSILDNQVIKREVRYTYQVNFKDVDTSERPGVVRSPEFTTIGDKFEINPRGEGLYYLDDIQIAADSFPWETYPTVEVHVRYSDPAHQINLEETFLLKQDKPEVTWKRFRLDPVLDTYEYKVIFRAADNRDREANWVTTDQERLTIRNPRPGKRTVRVVPAVDWSLASMIFVDLSYQDEANGILEEASLVFENTAEGKKSQMFSVDLMNPEQRLVSYTIKILLTDNRLIEVPASVTAGKEVFVRLDMTGHKIVTVQPEAVDFATRNVTRMQVSLKYEDSEAGLSFADSFTFTSPAHEVFFEYDYANAQKKTYSCQVKTFFTNGLAKEADLGVLDRDLLVLPVG